MCSLRPKSDAEESVCDKLAWECVAISSPFFCMQRNVPALQPFWLETWSWSFSERVLFGVYYCHSPALRLDKNGKQTAKWGGKKGWKCAAWVVKTREKNQKHQYRDVWCEEKETKRLLLLLLFMHNAHRAQVCPIMLLITLQSGLQPCGRGNTQQQQTEGPTHYQNIKMSPSDTETELHVCRFIQLTACYEPWEWAWRLSCLCVMPLSSSGGLPPLYWFIIHL